MALRPKLGTAQLLEALGGQTSFQANGRAVAGYLFAALKPLSLRMLLTSGTLRHEERLGRRDLLQTLEDTLQGALLRKLKRGGVFENEDFSLTVGKTRRRVCVYAFSLGEQGQVLLVRERPLRPATRAALEEVLGLTAYLTPLWATAQLGHTLAQEQLRLSERQVAFATNVSHELRTPLTTLSGYLKTLKRSAGEKISELLDISLAEAGKLERLVEGFQEFLKTEKDHDTPHVETFDAREAIRGLLAVHGQFAPAGRPLSGALPQEEMPVCFDLDLLQAIFGELLENARKYGAGPTVVSLAPGQENPMVHLRVADAGPGVSDEEIPHLFERFYKAHRPDAYNVGGTGLGLYVARQRAREAGGELTAETLPGGFAVVLEMPAATKHSD